MMITRIKHGSLTGGWGLAVGLLAWLTIALPAAADIELATLQSGTEVFTNVTVYNQTETDLFIKHARGFGNVKISSLDNATLRLLKLGGETPEEAAAHSASGKVAATMATVKAKLESSSPWIVSSEGEVRGLVSQVQITPNIIAIALLVYLLFCASLKLICGNAGSKPGWMIWFPVLQMFPLLRAAKMSAWWFVVFLIPLVGVVAHIVWCVKIAEACRKSRLVAVLLILPVTNLVAFLYLALSKPENQPAEKDTPPPRSSMVLGEA